MTAEKFILNKINSCITIEDDSYPNWVFYVYSHKISRLKKLYRIINEKFIFDYNNDKNKFVLFIEDKKNKYFVVRQDLSILMNIKYQNIQSLRNTYYDSLKKYKNLDGYIILTDQDIDKHKLSNNFRIIEQY